MPVSLVVMLTWKPVVLAALLCLLGAVDGCAGSALIPIPPPAHISVGLHEEEVPFAVGVAIQAAGWEVDRVEEDATFALLAFPDGPQMVARIQYGAGEATLEYVSSTGLRCEPPGGPCAEIDSAVGVWLEGLRIELAAELDARSPEAEQRRGTSFEEWRRSSGTGFAVSPDGLILTANHVIRYAQHIRVSLPDGSEVSAQVLRQDPENDLALLKVNAEFPTYLSLAGSERSFSGEEVFTFGFPMVPILGREPKFTDGVISALSGPGGVPNLMQISTPIQPGNSGGPVLIDSGEVVGVVTATAGIKNFRGLRVVPQNLNWAVKADYALPLVGVPAQPPASSREQAIRRARASVCLIELD